MGRPATWQVSEFSDAEAGDWKTWPTAVPTYLRQGCQNGPVSVAYMRRPRLHATHDREGIGIGFH